MPAARTPASVRAHTGGMLERAVGVVGLWGLVTMTLKGAWPLHTSLVLALVNAIYFLLPSLPDKLYWRLRTPCVVVTKVVTALLPAAHPPLACLHSPPPPGALQFALDFVMGLRMGGAGMVGLLALPPHLWLPSQAFLVYMSMAPARDCALAGMRHPRTVASISGFHATMHQASAALHPQLAPLDPGTLPEAGRCASAVAFWSVIFNFLVPAMLVVGGWRRPWRAAGARGEGPLGGSTGASDDAPQQACGGTAGASGSSNSSGSGGAGSRRRGGWWASGGEAGGLSRALGAVLAPLAPPRRGQCWPSCTQVGGIPWYPTALLAWGLYMHVLLSTLWVACLLLYGGLA